MIVLQVDRNLHTESRKRNIQPIDIISKRGVTLISIYASDLLFFGCPESPCFLALPCALSFNTEPDPNIAVGNLNSLRSKNWK